jgi:hypothetical protein
MKDELQPLKSLWLKNNVDMAIHIAREARQMLGGMGITGEYSHEHLESVITYEGTRYSFIDYRNGYYDSCFK